jgi:hypothetical protein
MAATPKKAPIVPLRVSPRSTQRGWPRAFSCGAPSSALNISCITVRARAQWCVIDAVKNDAFIAVKKLAFPAGKTTLIKQNSFWLGTGGDTCRLHV